MGDDERLRELHDTYAWEVNAAVGEGRLDLVSQLADDLPRRGTAAADRCGGGRVRQGGVRGLPGSLARRPRSAAGGGAVG